MNIIRALLVVLGCLALGEATFGFWGLKLPGSIVGMALLFAALQAGWVKLSWVGRTGRHFDGKPDFIFGAALRGRHQLFRCDCKRLVFDFDGHNRQYDLRYCW